LREWFRTRHSDLLRTISDTGELPAIETLDGAIGAYKLSRGKG
jgi:hypothetical protein